MSRFDDRELHPEQRVAEVAGILAAGVLRSLTSRASLAESPSETPSEESSGILETPVAFVPETSLCDHAGSRPQEPKEAM